jgi:CelD/BcsL family acetyltransferase involved in cellulose biosynthesis
MHAAARQGHRRGGGRLTRTVVGPQASTPHAIVGPRAGALGAAAKVELAPQASTIVRLRLVRLRLERMREEWRG